MTPDLANPGHMLPALPLNELQAAVQQVPPVARVPENDPMVLTNNQPDINKLNAYRIGVDQSPVPTLAAASTRTYCKHLLAIGPARIQLDMQLTQGRPSPDPAVANSLFTFLEQRFVASYGANGLNCVGLLNKPDPVMVTLNGNVAVNAAININGANATGNGNGNGNGNNNGNGNGNGNNNGNGNGNGNNNNNGNGDTNTTQIQQVTQVMQCMGQQQMSQTTQCTQMMQQQQGQMSMQMQMVMQNLQTLANAQQALPSSQAEQTLQRILTLLKVPDMQGQALQQLLSGLVSLTTLPAMQTQPVQATAQCFQGVLAQQNVQGQQVMQCVQNNG
jgi:hypothetical protein